MSFRYMRMLLFFDLPRGTSKEISRANWFVKNIKKEGFIMIQESVYCKLLLNMSSFDSIRNKLEKFKPFNGSILLLTITEKQFNNIDILLGELNHCELDDTKRMVIL